MKKTISLFCQCAATFFDPAKNRVFEHKLSVQPQKIKGVLAAIKEEAPLFATLQGFDVERTIQKGEGPYVYEAKMGKRHYVYGEMISVFDATCSQTIDKTDWLDSIGLDGSKSKLHPSALDLSPHQIRQIDAENVSHLYKPDSPDSLWRPALSGVIVLDRKTDQPILWVPAILLDERKKRSSKTEDKVSYAKSRFRKNLGITDPAILAKLSL